MTNDPERGNLSRVRLNNQFGLWCRSEEMVMNERRMAFAGAAYALAAVACFGPATVQSERARDEYRAQCRAERVGDAEAQRWCVLGGPSVSDGLHKAVFWPLWLSYMVASR